MLSQSIIENFLWFFAGIRKSWNHDLICFCLNYVSDDTQHYCWWQMSSTTVYCVHLSLYEGNFLKYVLFVAMKFTAHNCLHCICNFHLYCLNIAEIIPFSFLYQHTRIVSTIVHLNLKTTLISCSIFVHWVIHLQFSPVFPFSDSPSGGCDKTFKFTKKCWALGIWHVGHFIWWLWLLAQPDKFASWVKCVIMRNEVELLMMRKLFSSTETYSENNSVESCVNHTRSH